MTEQDRKGFLILMTLLGEAFKEETSTERAKIYFEFLKNYSLYQIMGSIQAAIKQLKFYPKVSDLLDIIEGYGGNYRFVESEENKKLRLRSEEKQLMEFVNQISKIFSKKGEEVKQIT